MAQNKITTPEQGHTSDLIFDDGKTRKWESRLTIEDGEVYRFYTEKFINGKWHSVGGSGTPKRS